MMLRDHETAARQDPPGVFALGSVWAGLSMASEHGGSVTVVPDDHWAALRVRVDFIPNRTWLLTLQDERVIAPTTVQPREVVDGYVWCDHHGAVHREESDPYDDDTGCLPTEWHALAMDREAMESPETRLRRARVEAGRCLACGRPPGVVEQCATCGGA